MIIINKLSTSMIINGSTDLVQIFFVYLYRLYIYIDFTLHEIFIVFNMYLHVSKCIFNAFNR